MASAPAVARAVPAAPSSSRPRSIDEALALFREGLPVVASLAGGERSRDALVRRLALAIARRDTSEVRAMSVTRAEFAYLYYPESPYVRPPTRQEAPLVWFFLRENSQKGITRAFNRYGGHELGYAGHACEAGRRGPAMTVWDRCLVRITTAWGDTVATRLFGSIIERDGRYKVLSYSNDL